MWTATGSPLAVSQCGVVEPMNVIAEWSGQDFFPWGLSLRPFRHLPLVITPAVN